MSGKEIKITPVDNGYLVRSHDILNGAAVKYDTFHVALDLQGVYEILKKLELDENLKKISGKDKDEIPF